MNIFHQLRTGGDPDFKDIYAEVPWPEFKERPDQPDEELVERWKQLPSPRAFKSHSMPGPDGNPLPEMGAFSGDTFVPLPADRCAHEASQRSEAPAVADLLVVANERPWLAVFALQVAEGSRYVPAPPELGLQS